jgi:tripartite-type tricarboxylate transporter receptor subunit TctC
MAKLGRASVIAAVGGLYLGGSIAAAQSLDDFFKNQPFKIIVGSPPGGSYDLYGRAIARHLGNHLPGQPTVIVQNMPGGGGYLAVNYLYNNAPKDGSVIATFSRSVPMQPLTDSTGVQFDPSKLEWIGSASDEVGLVLSWNTSPVKTYADLQRLGMTVASTGPGTDSNVYPRVVSNILGVNIKIVTGYPGAADMLLAVERGEVDGAAGISWSSLWPNKKDWIESHKLNLLVQLGLKSAHAQLKDVPLILDLVQNETDRRVLEVIFARQAMAYPYAAPPGVPPARLSAIRAAFAKTLADERFLTEANRAGMSVNPGTPEELTAIIKRVYDSPPEVIAKVKAAMGLSK